MKISKINLQCPSLGDLLNYKNENVLHRFEKDYKNTRLDSQSAFKELMRFLWLAEKHYCERKQFPEYEQLQFKCYILEEMVEIDYMWHTFLLFTKDYAEFCQTYFGKFIHHHPVSLASDEETVNESDLTKNNRLFLNYIYDELGESTFRTWFNIPKI